MICFRVKVWSVVLRLGRKLHRPLSSFHSIIFWHFLSRHLAYTFLGKLASGIPLQFVHSLRSSFLNFKIIARLICNLSKFCQISTRLGTLALTGEFLFSQRFQHLDLISSSPAAFPDFIPLIAVTTSAAMKTSSFPKCITFCVSRVNTFTAFKRSSKYSLHRARILFSSVKMFPTESLMEVCDTQFFAT